MIYSKDVLGEHVVVTWTKIFGAYGEDTHWKRLLESADAQIGQEPFDTTKILKATGLSQYEWHKFHTQMKIARNQFFAHFDLASMTLHFPDLESALHSALAYREWLSSFLNAAIANGYLARNRAVPNDEVFSQFEEEASMHLVTCSPNNSLQRTPSPLRRLGSLRPAASGAAELRRWALRKI